MRLFDKVASQGPEQVRNAIRTLNDSFAVLRVDSIANDYATSQKLWWSPEDYPYFRLPWDRCFIEWNEPKVIVSDLGTQETNGKNQIGIMAVAIQEGRINALFDGLREMCGKTDADWTLPKDATNGVVLSFYYSQHARPLSFPRIAMFVATTADGFVRKRLITGEDCQSWTENLGSDAMQRFFDSQMHIAALACTFANCKNVKLVDAVCDAPAEKIRRRLKLPEVKRYTLSIHGRAATRVVANDGEPSEDQVAYHLCRGHFSTYTLEKPLFGKLVGRFWVPPHTRGSKDRGEVKKDYAIAGSSLG